MKPLSALLGFGTVLGLSSLAVAEPTVKASNETAKAPAASGAVFEQLPSVKLTLPKRLDLPKSVPATEKVDGYFIEVPNHYKNATSGPTYAMVFASEEVAKARNSGQQIPAQGSCFMTAYPNHGTDINWSSSFGTAASVQNYSRASYPGAPQYGSVNLVRSDTIVSETKDKLRYEVKLAFVDAETMGVRLHSKQTMDFTLVRELPGQVKVWGSKGEDEVMFLVHRKKHEKERFSSGSLMATVNGMHQVSSTEECPVIVSLKTGKGASSSAVVQLEAILEVVDIDQGDEDAGEGFLSARPVLSLPNADQFRPREAKFRPMRIGLSSTWFSQDTKPVVSVSHGWSGKERTQQI